MRIRVARVLILVAAGLWLAGCSTAPKLADSTPPDAAAGAAPDVTGTVPGTQASVVTPPAEPGPSGEPAAPLSAPGLLGDDPHDDVALGKKYFRANNFGLAEESFRAAAAKHPRDAEAWVGLAASYDRLRRFDLADRAYREAIHIVGPTVEILNDEGFSYMLRGDYGRANALLNRAAALDPNNPYVQANMRLLDEAFQKGKAVQ